MLWSCSNCGKQFPDKMLDDPEQVSADELRDMIVTDAIVCVECAGDRFRLSSTTNLPTRSNRDTVKSDVGGRG